MEDFGIMGFIGGIFGFIVGIIIIVTLGNEKPKMSGSYMVYQEKIYQEVPQEELENIIVLEVKE